MAYVNFSRKRRFLENQNRWRYAILVKTKKFRLNVKIKNKSFFWPTRNFSRNDVFWKSKPFNIWNFGKNKKVSFWCDNFENKIRKNTFSSKLVKPGPKWKEMIRRFQKWYQFRLTGAWFISYEWKSKMKYFWESKP